MSGLCTRLGEKIQRDVHDVINDVTNDVTNDVIFHGEGWKASAAKRWKPTGGFQNGASRKARAAKWQEPTGVF